MAGADLIDLEVSVSSIVIDFNDGSSRSATIGHPFNAVIDSTLPYLYLPSSVCDNIADTLGLIPTNTTSGYPLYTINQTQRASNYQRVQDIKISVTNMDALGNPGGPYNGTTITFPYAAFDLNATWPISPDNMTSYFPILPAPTNTFILGRAFFQEAYVIADFDRRLFSVYRSKFPGPDAESLVPIYNIITGAELHAQLSGGAIAGIVVGCFAFIAIVVGIVSIWWRLWLARKRRANETADGTRRKNSRKQIISSSLSGLAANSSLELEANALGSSAIGEMEDKSDATQWQVSAQRISELPQSPKSPQEME